MAEAVLVHCNAMADASSPMLLRCRGERIHLDSHFERYKHVFDTEHYKRNSSITAYWSMLSLKRHCWKIFSRAIFICFKTIVFYSSKVLKSFFDIGEAILNEEYDIIGKMFTVPHRQSLVVWLSVVTHAAVPVSAGCALPSHVL